MNIYPLLGFGGGGSTIGITDKSKIPDSFDNLLENPARESYITNGGFMMNFSIGADFFILGSRTENASGGWIMGIKAGYIYNVSGNDWYFNSEKIKKLEDFLKTTLQCLFLLRTSLLFLPGKGTQPLSLKIRKYLLNTRSRE